MDYLNLGCGSRFHPDWINVDFVSTGEGVIAWNLRRGIPFSNASFDVVYHSHVLEHFPKQEAEHFLRECYRVLRSNGILRVVVPDLEQIARLYLTALEQAIQGSSDWANHYNWLLLEMYDQVARNRSGGEMVAYLAQPELANEDFVVQRIGREGENLIAALRQSQGHFSSAAGQLSERDTALKSVLGDDDYSALQTGRFRQSGEVHQWMYDRYSLKVILEQVGFEQVKVCQAQDSAIANFEQYHLDVEPGGQIRKPDSLFIEAIKPVTDETPTAPILLSHEPSLTREQLADPLSLLSSQQTVEQLRQELRQAQTTLRETQVALEQSHNRISAMESSKFWKIRRGWLQLKQRLGLPVDQA